MFDELKEVKYFKEIIDFKRIILEIEGSVRQRYKRALFP